MTPRFDIGQRVFIVDIIRETRRHPCPDCNDTRTWTATSRAGESFTINCLRCSQTYSGVEVAPLAYEVAVVVVKELTVGSIQMDTNDRTSMFRYMCVETGVGTGLVYNEVGRGRLYATLEEAEADGDVLRKEEESRIIAQPHHITSEQYARRTLGAAVPYRWREEIYHAWDRARDLTEAIEDVVKPERDNCHCDEITTLEEAKEHLADALRPKSWRRPHPVDELIDAVKEHIVMHNEHVERIERALNALDYVKVTSPVHE